MAPVKAKGAPGHKARKSATSGPSKSKVVKRPPPKQVKTKPASAILSQAKPKKKKPQYTDAQLNLPSLNSIIPASATAAQRTGKGTGKKNKIYVDDQESMMTILAMVNAEKEGIIESKMMKERQLEEIREARRNEAEKRAGERKGKFEEAKKEMKGKTKGSRPKDVKPSLAEDARPGSDTTNGAKGQKKRKSVSFA